MSSQEDEAPPPPRDAPPPAPEAQDKRKSRFRRRGTALFKKAFGKGKKKTEDDFLDVEDDGLRTMREEEARKIEGKVGWLEKKGEDRTNWKRRYFVLSGPFLAYYATEPAVPGADADMSTDDGSLGVPQGQRLGMIPLRGAKIEHYFHRNRSATFRVVHPERRTFFLSAADDDEKFEWMDALSNASVQIATAYELTEFYNDLGISMGTSLPKIKKHYRKLALRHHPDKGGDPAKFHKITEAYEVLCSLKAQEETLEEEEAQYDVVTVTARVQKGPPGVGMGLHIGARFVGVPREEVIMILGTSGIAEASGEVQADDIIRKINRINLRTLAFNDVVKLLTEVAVGDHANLELERHVSKNGSSSSAAGRRDSTAMRMGRTSSIIAEANHAGVGKAGNHTQRPSLLPSSASHGGMHTESAPLNSWHEDEDEKMAAIAEQKEVERASAVAAEAGLGATPDQIAAENGKLRAQLLELERQMAEQQEEFELRILETTRAFRAEVEEGDTVRQELQAALAARDSAQHEAAEATKKLIQAEAELAQERLHGGGGTTSSSARQSAHVRKTSTRKTSRMNANAGGASGRRTSRQTGSLVGRAAQDRKMHARQQSRSKLQSHAEETVASQQQQSLATLFAALSITEAIAGQDGVSEAALQTAVRVGGLLGGGSGAMTPPKVGIVFAQTKLSRRTVLDSEARLEAALRKIAGLMSASYDEVLENIRFAVVEQHADPSRGAGFGASVAGRPSRRPPPAPSGSVPANATTSHHKPMKMSTRAGAPREYQGAVHATWGSAHHRGGIEADAGQADAAAAAHVRAKLEQRLKYRMRPAELENQNFFNPAPGPQNEL